jgi:diacylglycerol O-acyltransferase
MNLETDAQPQPDSTLPQRVLIVSAEMGEGHNAAARAITETINEVWPGCEVDRLDTIELRGRRFARWARWAYGAQLTLVPWSYQIFYDALGRYDWFTRLAKAVVMKLFGRRLEAVASRRHDDLVISTYPFGSAALDWLRRNRGMTTPTVTYVPAFHVHPLWTYPGVDMHFVMYDTAAADARTAGIQSGLRLGAPPVRRGFGDLSKAQARDRLGVPQQDFVVLISGGAWGLGHIDRGVKALLGVDPPVHVLAVCGKNSGLMSELKAARAGARGRLTVYGYVDNMPDLMAAADVVVTNGAGVTVLEALKTPRPVIAFSPLVGHGRAATAEMVRRDLALVAEDATGLAQQVRRLATDDTLLKRMERAGQDWVTGRDLRESVADMAELVRSRRSRAPGATAR